MSGLSCDLGEVLAVLNQRCEDLSMRIMAADQRGFTAAREILARNVLIKSETSASTPSDWPFTSLFGIIREL